MFQSHVPCLVAEGWGLEKPATANSQAQTFESHKPNGIEYGLNPIDEGALSIEALYNGEIVYR